MATVTTKQRKNYDMKESAIVRKRSDAISVPCHCGQSTRFFTGKDQVQLGLHLTSIAGAKPHYHKEMTEVYYVVEGSGTLVLDNEKHDVSVGDSIYIPVGVVHHAEGDFKVIVVYNHPECHETDTYYPE